MSENVKTYELPVQEMLQNKPVEPDFVIDGIHFGRGDAYICKYTKRTYKLNLEKTMVWKIVENGLDALSDDLIGQFYSDCSYIVYSKFRTEVFDASLQNKLEEFFQDICFYWRGAIAPKGFSPLPPELEENNPPVERIPQWSELPIFLRLFRGKMVVHQSESPDQNSNDRLYILRGTVDEEIHFFEVAKEKRSLRSRTSFALVRPKQKKIVIWHGHKSDKRNGIFFRKFSDQISKYISRIYETELSTDFTVEEIHEQEQNKEFYGALDGSSEDYFSLVDETHVYKSNPKLFYFNSITGSFLATAVQDLLFSVDFTNPFPYLQEHLYSPAQPALFLFDSDKEVWLWQGPIPNNFGEDDFSRFEQESEAFLKTAISYAKAKYFTESNVFFTSAGSEPIEFTNLFPFWQTKFQSKEKIKVKVKSGENVCVQFCT